jgi:hypothetical protein
LEGFGVFGRESLRGWSCVFFLTSSIFGGEKLEDLAGVWKVESPFESGVWRVEEFFCLVVKTKSGKKFVRVLRGGRKGSLSLLFGETQN